MDHLCGSFAMRKLLPRRELQQLTCIPRKLNSAVDGVEECAKIIKICSKLLHYQMFINRISTIQIVIFLN